MEFFTEATALAALAVVAVQQILKTIPSSFTDFANKYPVPTNVVLSIGAVLFAVYQNNELAQPDVWTEWVGLVALVSVSAAIVYNQLVGKSKQIKGAEKTAP